MSHAFSFFSSKRPVIGMIHLPALPGSPRYVGSVTMEHIRDWVLRDADALADGGVDGLMIENFGDVPFYPGRAPAHTVAAMVRLAGAVRDRFTLPLGINVLRNDGQSALAVAAAVGAQFVRVNILCGARLADQGIIQGQAHEILRERAMLGAKEIKVLADVDVKHSAALAQVSLESEVEDTLVRGLADGLIVSGTGTGKATDPGQLERVKAVAGSAPVFVGSGADEQTIGHYLPFADGFIIGSAFKKGGKVNNPVAREKVERIVGVVRAA